MRYVIPIAYSCRWCGWQEPGNEKPPSEAARDRVARAISAHAATAHPAEVAEYRRRLKELS